MLKLIPEPWSFFDAFSRSKNTWHTAKYTIDLSHEGLVHCRMKADDTDVPDGLHYTKEHEWVKIENDKCRVGITDYAQRSLHEVVYVDLPNIGKVLTQNAIFGTVESVKAVSELYSPISGEVMERNNKLVDSPELVNQEPYGAGWIVVVKPSRLQDDLKMLLDAKAYASFIQEVTKKK
jgi:glycine cleavage system H protein